MNETRRMTGHRYLFPREYVKIPQGDTMYKYETHLHTLPVSRCAQAGIEENLKFYKQLGYDGVFITNHFLDGNINIDWEKPYEEKIAFYFSDYEKALELGKAMGIKVFCGAELSYNGIDFLVYGLNKEWFLAHPEIMEMEKSDELRFMRESGALIIHAHPYRGASSIDHIRLFPGEVHGVEVINAGRTEWENAMAKQYAGNYDLIEFAGSDNHRGANTQALAGICTEEPILNEQDFTERVKNKKAKIFSQFC